VVITGILGQVKAVLQIPVELLVGTHLVFLELVAVLPGRSAGVGDSQEICVHNVFFISIGVFLGLFLIASGLLLAFWPVRFLRFYDFWNRGDYVGRTASWRQKVGTIEYRLLGLVCFVAGVVVLWDVLHIGF